MFNLADKFLNYDFVIKILDHRYADYLYNLGDTEILIIKMLVIVLAVFVVLRLLGAGAVLVFLFMLFIAYVVFSNNILGFYEKRNEETKQHFKEIEEYMTTPPPITTIKEKKEDDDEEDGPVLE